MAQIRITRKNSTDAEVVLALSVEQLDEIEKEAEARGMTLTDSFGEAFRLQRLFNKVKTSDDKALYYRSGDDMRELESV